MKPTRTAATQRTYAEDWARFEDWCAAMASRALPADPLVVMFYLGHLAPTMRPARPTDPPDAVTARGEVCESPGLAPTTLRRHLAAIAARHTSAGHANPTRDTRVIEMFASIRDRAADSATRRVAPPVPDQIRTLVASLTGDASTGMNGDQDPVVSRDLALILLGFSASLRPAQIAALTLDRVREHDDGAWIDVLHDADPGTGETAEVDDPWTASTRIPAVGDSACPVAAWRRWRAWLPEEHDESVPGRHGGAAPDAPAFRAIRKGRPTGGDDAARAAARRRIGRAALTERSVARIVSGRAIEAGMPGHWTAGHLSRHDTLTGPAPRETTGPRAPTVATGVDRVFRLVYRSRLTGPPARRSAEIAAILAGARRKNAELDVTGALLIREDHVVQALEGTEVVVRDLYATIAADPRHEDVTTLEARHLRTRTFGRWSMARIAAHDSTPTSIGTDEIREGPRSPRHLYDAVITTMRDDAEP